MNRDNRSRNRIAIGMLCAMTFAILVDEIIATNLSISTNVSISTDETTARQLFESHCYSCHSDANAEAGFRIDQLEPVFDQRRSAEQWAEVMDRINGGDMPPQGEPRLDAEQSSIVTEWIADELRAASENPNRSDGHVVLRRMNRIEYRNTIRDLLGIDYDPSHDFPADPPAHGFDNIGEALSVSPILMEKYLIAARDVIDRAIFVGDPPPKHVWHMEVEQAHRSNQFDGRRSAGDDELWTADPVTQRHRYLIKGGGAEVIDGFVVQTGSRNESRAGFRWFRIPAAGRYTIRIRAASHVPSRSEVVQSAQDFLLQHHRQDDWKDAEGDELDRLQAAWLEDEWPEIESHFKSESMYDYGFPRMKVTTDEGVIIGEITVDAPRSEPEIYEFHFEFEPDPNSTEGVNIQNAYRIPRVLENFWFQGDRAFAKPELWIDWVEFEGVTVDDDSGAQRHPILFDSPLRESDESAYVRTILSSFASRAWRRPVQELEIEQLVSLYAHSRQSGSSLETAIKVPLIATLASPHFLFLVEPNEASERRPLSDYELATRLSYFLWSSTPDQTLRDLASSGQLANEEELEKQIDRMLADDRANALVENFVGQWLGTRDVGANPPVENLFPRYDDHLEESMIRESEAFFAEVLHNDLSVLNFIDSDFVVINERMARFYGITDVEGNEFRRVEIDPASHRGGVLGQASILTLTSNGTRTSLVIRGVWILENLLGDPPSPPPPDAGDLAPSVPGIGKATVRDRLLAHREIPQCASCHEKIDPLGFALENFDAHGRWREQYGFGYNGRVGRNDPIVDSQGALPNGRTFDGVDGLKGLLLEQQDAFLNCLTEKLMTYALGRGVNVYDRLYKEAFVEVLRDEEQTLRRLIKEIVKSELFRFNRRTSSDGRLSIRACREANPHSANHHSTKLHGAKALLISTDVVNQAIILVAGVRKYPN